MFRWGNLMDKVHGVGYNHLSPLEQYGCPNRHKSISVWRGMIERCYNHQSQTRHPTYIGCTVAEEWHDYQVFAEWYLNHDFYGLGYELDKDLLVPNNKVYSPDNCTLVPRDLNSLLLDHRNARGVYPQGVYWNKQAKKYRSQINMSGSRKYLGSFDTINEAYEVYKEAKERYVKNKALEWANRIEWDVFVALMNWELNP